MKHEPYLYLLTRRAPRHLAQMVSDSPGYQRTGKEK